MKKLIIILSLGLTAGIFNVNTADAQHVSIHINLDRQPAWGPSGYDYAAFYYFPELNIYFDVNNALFYYPNGRRWVSSYYLPLKYINYDLYRMYKVVLNDLRQPWRHNKTHRTAYVRYHHNRSQVPIRAMNDHRYNKAKSNTRAWVEPQHTPQNNRSPRSSGNPSSTVNSTRSDKSSPANTQSSRKDEKKKEKEKEKEKKSSTSGTQSRRSSGSNTNRR
jgi:hypothetical protein